MKNTERKLNIAIAEDNAGDITLVREALDAQNFTYELHVKRDGEQMISFLDAIERRELECPDLFILDLNLPRIPGEVLLSKIGDSSLLRQVPAIVTTSSDSPKDREMVGRSEAKAYFRKPSDYEEFLKLGGIVRSVLAG